MSSDAPTPRPTPPALPAPGTAAAVQLKDLPDEQLNELARDLGIDPSRFEHKAALVSALLNRRTLIANMDKNAMLELITWTGKDVPAAAGKEQLAREIIAARKMRFSGLSHHALVCLAQLRGVDVTPQTPTPLVIEKLKDQEGFFGKLGRKRRALVGKLVSRIVGDDSIPHTPTDAPVALPGVKPTPTRPTSSQRKLSHEIEESGLLSGLTRHVRQSADTYINEKLDEIEARIDRKLDEIDRRLGEWRDKEVASRIRILKISLWATVVVGAVTLVISYLSVHLLPLFWGQ